ncbi:MAG: UDP-2,3-diacylglucosamine diphosphatase LpxI [Candidatus Omnitrophica bacterium]|nr:UDP-2,3-diacylglucosamine diphosphatase LpxI [Candidatus Omnitrophota bacterium]
MKLALIAGNRNLPLAFLQCALRDPELEIIPICFKGETSPRIKKYASKIYWIEVGQLATLIEILEKENISQCVMVGQISPYRIFKQQRWDTLMRTLAKRTDYRPHSIFTTFIGYLEGKGINFLDSTLYMNDLLIGEGQLNAVSISPETSADIDFGIHQVSRYVELDVGQTIVVKNKAVLALEALEGTDNTIKRGYRIGKRNCVVLKFSKKDQDLRFDVPVVGLSTLRLLKKIKASALVLEASRVLILEKERFLKAAEQVQIAVVGTKRI